MKCARTPYTGRYTRKILCEYFRLTIKKSAQPAHSRTYADAHTYMLYSERLSGGEPSALRANTFMQNSARFGISKLWFVYMLLGAPCRVLSLLFSGRAQFFGAMNTF